MTRGNSRGVVLISLGVSLITRSPDMDHAAVLLFQFQIKDEIKAARLEATKAYR